jgi:hypothetical protein
MTTTQHVAWAGAVTSATAPRWRVELRAGAHHMVGDEPATNIEVDVRYDIADDGQASITRTITVPAGLPSDHQDRLAGIAERTPVTLAVHAGTPITTTLRANDGATTPPSRP